MKRLIILSVIVFALTSFTSEAKTHRYWGGYFYTELAPYGQWIEIDYGVVVWRPTIMQVTWAPYRTGRWIWTVDGWYWDSYEPFGHITYHYGRWFYDDYYGWLWYPDYEWAPAWVEWRYSNDYIGWAPLHPYASFSISIGIFFTSVYYTPYHHWHFVSFGQFCHPHVYNYYVAPSYRYRVYNNTRYRTNYAYHNGRVQNRGIDIDYVRVRSGQEIRQRDVTRVRDPRDRKRGSYNNRDEIRTLDVPREQLARNDVRTMDIQKDRRKTSLDINKVEIGERNRTKQVVKNERKLDKQVDRKDINRVQKNKERKDVNKNVITNKRNVEKKNKVDVKREKVVKTNKKDVKNNQKVFDRDKTQKKTNKTVTKKQNTDRKKTVVKNNSNRNKQFKVKTNTNKKKKTDVKRNTNKPKFEKKVTTKKNTVKKNDRTKKNNDRKVDTRKNTQKINKNDSRQRRNR